MTGSNRFIRLIHNSRLRTERICLRGIWLTLGIVICSHETGYSLKWVPVTDASALWNIQYQYPLLPVMRMSEIYYIMCEYLAETDLPRAINLLNTLKIARGAAELNTSLTKDEFLDRMYMDATRESIAEGQTFYLYKRLNRDMYNGEYPIDMSGGKYVIPLPDSETIIQ